MQSRRIIAAVVFFAVLGAAIGATLLAAGGARAAVPGKVLWSKRLATPYGRGDSVTDMGVAPDGSVYVLARILRSDDGNDTVVGLVKYSRGGAKRWLRTFKTTGAAYDVPVGLALDGSGNAYVVAYTRTAGGVTEGVLVKYAPSGKRRWVRRWAGRTVGDDLLLDVACDADGNAVVCGYENLDTGRFGLFVRKYRPGGSVKWTRRYGSGRSNDGAYELVIDARTGAIYVGGSLSRLVAPDTYDQDIVVLKYTAAGKRAWAKKWASAGGYDDSVDALALGPSGELYVGGNVRDSMWGRAALLNFGKGGGLHWVDDDTAKSPLPLKRVVEAIGVDRRERLRVLLSHPPGTPPAPVRLYSAAGTLKWERPLPIAGDRIAPEDAVVTGTGKMYVTGHVRPSGESNVDLFVMALRADATSLWTTFRDGPGGSSASGTCVALRSGRLFVAGVGDGGVTSWDVMTLRLVP